MEISEPEKKYIKSIFLSFLFLIGLIIFLFNLKTKLFLLVINEKGPIETISYIGYFVALIIALWLTKQKFLNDNYLISLILLILGLRELDFQKRFTTYSITGTKLYFASEASIQVKIIAFTILLGVITVLILFLKRYLIKYLIDCKNLAPHTFITLPIFLLLLLSKLFDKSLTTFKDLGLLVSHDVMKLSLVLEESVEVIIPLLIIHALMYQFTRKSISK